MISAALSVGEAAWRAGLSEIAGAAVHLNLEHRQTTGSFKLRCASNAVASLSPEEKRRGVVAASTGNHGRALTHAVKLEGIRVVICMSRLVPENKVSEIRRLGAEVRIIGNSQNDAQEEAERLAAHEGLLMLRPFDCIQIIAGQGTIGLEMLEDVPDTATVAMPVSGGGLAAGIATAVSALKDSVRVVGVSMARGAAMKASLDAGRPVLVEDLLTLADSSVGSRRDERRDSFCSDPSGRATALQPLSRKAKRLRGFTLSTAPMRLRPRSRRNFRHPRGPPF